MTGVRRYRFAVIGGIVAMATVAGASWYALAQTTPVAVPQTQPFVGTISGTVRYKNGKPAYGFRVRARSTENRRAEREAVTDDGGNFTLKDLHGWRVRNGKIKYTVTVESEGKPFLPMEPSRTVTLTPTDKKRDSVDFVLDAAPEVTVRVRDAETDAPIIGYPVSANASGYGSDRPFGVTDANGEFVVRSATSEVEIRLDENQQNPNNAAPGYSDYFRKTLAPGTKTVWEIKAYSPGYNLPRTLRGTVVDKNGKPVYGATVRVVSDNGSSSPTVGQTRTNLAGAFALPIIRLDHPAVLIVREWGKSEHETVSRPLTPQDTWKPLVVRVGRANSATVTGTCVDTQGKPAPGVSVTLSSIFLRDAAPNAEVAVYWVGRGGADAVVSGADGRFTVRGVFGQTRNSFSFGGKGWGKSRYPAANYTNGWVYLKPNEKRNIGKVVVYRADKSITGRLVDNAGEPVSRNVSVIALGEHTDVSVSPEKDGTFTLSGLVDEPLSLLIVYSTGSSSGYTADSMFYPYKRAVKAGATNLRILAPPRNVVEETPAPP